MLRYHSKALEADGDTAVDYYYALQWPATPPLVLLVTLVVVDELLLLLVDVYHRLASFLLHVVDIALLLLLNYSEACFCHYYYYHVFLLRTFPVSHFAVLPAVPYLRICPSYCHLRSAQNSCC